MLAALRQQGRLGAVGIGETGIVQQAAAGSMTAVADDPFGHPNRLSQPPPALGHSAQHQRRCRVLHGMEVQKKIDRIVKRSQRPGAGQFDRVAGAVQNLGRPDPVEVLVNEPRSTGTARIEALIGRHIREAQCQLSAYRPYSLAEQEVQGDGAA